MERDARGVAEGAEAERDVARVVIGRKRRIDRLGGHHPYRHRRDHLVGRARQAAQHVRGVGSAFRLAEDVAVFHDHRVRADHDEHAFKGGVCQDFLHDRARLALGELLACLGRIGQKVGLERLVDLGSVHGEGNARLLK